MSKEFEEQKKEAFLDYVYKETDKTQECSLHNRPVSECEDICELFVKEDDHERFDMYARDVNDYSWLQEFVPGLVIYSAGGFFPFQASGYLHGLHLYFRAEQGYASIRLAENKSDCHIPERSLYSSTINTEQYSDTVDELHKRWLSYLLTCIDQLEKTEYLYYFESNEITYESSSGKFGIDVKRDENGDIIPSEYGPVGWGKNIDEAFKNASDTRGLHYSFCENPYDDMKEKYPKDWQKYEDRKWSEEKFEHYLKLRDIRPIVQEVKGTDRIYPSPEPVFEVKVPESWRKDGGMIEIPLS